jgi:hypothetical protein
MSYSIIDVTHKTFQKAGKKPFLPQGSMISNRSISSYVLKALPLIGPDIGSFFYHFTTPGSNLSQNVTLNTVNGVTKKLQW